VSPQVDVVAVVAVVAVDAAAAAELQENWLLEAGVLKRRAK